MELGLGNRVALVSGGTHGIGRACALALAAEGCRVAVFSRTPERVDLMARELEAAGADFLCLNADADREEEMARVVESVVARWGAVHVLVNNVGGGGRWGKDVVEETAPEVWTEVYRRNAGAAIQLTMLCLPHMKREGFGRVVTITSIFGREGGARPWFAMAKTAQTALMKSLAKYRDLAGAGITFNSVAPGAIEIPDTGWEKMKRERPDEYRAFIDRELPLGRLGTPEEVAALVVFLSSSAASLVNGASIPADGGEGRSLL